MELVTRETARNTPIGTRTGKVVHLFWMTNGDAVYSLCDRKIRGEAVVRSTDDEICEACELERDYRAARKAGFEHRVSHSLATTERHGRNYKVVCKDCGEDGEPVELWRRNGTTMTEAQAVAVKHYVEAYRKHLVAEREAARVAEYADRNRRVTINRRVLRDSIELVGVDALTGRPAEDQANAVYDRFLSEAEYATPGAVFTAGDLAQALSALEARALDGGHNLSYQEQAAWILERFGSTTITI
jgi:hypothetical protein